MLDEVKAKHDEKNGSREDSQHIHTMIPIVKQSVKTYNYTFNSCYPKENLGVGCCLEAQMDIREVAKLVVNHQHRYNNWEPILTEFYLPTLKKVR